MNRLIRLFVLTLLLMLAVGVASAQDDLKVIVVGSPAGDPHSLDPQQAVDTRDWNLGNNLFPGLTTLNEETREVVAGVVTGWDVSEDGLTHTFHIIPEVPWVRYNAESGAVEQVMDDEGNPRYVTASDVVFSFQRALDPETGSSLGYMLGPVIANGVEFNSGAAAAEDMAVVAIDDYTVEITSPEAVAYAIGIFGIIPTHLTPQWAIEASGDTWTEPENINTYGPFALKEWVHDDHLTYIKNPFWPGSEGYPQAKLDEIVLRFLEPSVQLNEYQAGNMDVVPVVPSNQFDQISADPVLSEELTVTAGMCTTAWNFHTQKPPFDNVHIRRAFSYAVDQQSLADNVFKGGRIPARWYTPPSVAFAPTLENNPDLGIAFDAATATSELAAGLSDLGLTTVDELPPITVDFGNSELNNSVAQALQVMWQATLGVTVTLNPIDSTSYWSLMGEDAGQIHTAGWCPDYNDANNYTRDVYYTGGANNFGRWSNAEFDAMVDEARTSTDNARRSEIYAQAEQLMIVDEAVTIPLVWESIPSLTKPNVTRTFAPNGVESYAKWDIS